MIRPTPAALVLCALTCAAVVLPAPARAQDPLPLGSTTPGNGATGYRVTVPGAGFLTVMARSASDDIRIRVTDDEGQTLPDGQVDIDYGGDVGAEQAVVVLPRAGTYMVQVETYSGSAATYTVGGSFLASTLVETAADPDGKPSTARTLAAGADHSDTIDPASGDYWDWYRIEADQSGILTILTRADEGDLRLELFADGAFGEALESSDQDEGDVLGNESVTVDVTAGQAVYVRVGPSFLGTGGGPVAYRVASGLIPG